MNNKTTQIIIGVLVVLLMGASFTIGSMYTQLQGQGTAPAADNGTQQAAGNQESATEKLTKIAADLNLDGDDFSACLADNPGADHISENRASGTAAGVRGTPGNVLYNTQSGAAILVPGAYPLEAMSLFVDTMLENPNATSQELLALLQTAANEQSPGLGDNLTVVSTVSEVVSRDHVRGNENAQIALIEYSDFSCGFCQRFHPTATALVENYDEVMWVYRHFPVLGQNSDTYAQGSECAYELGGHEAFWEMSDQLFTN